jgi:hypothetical protein
MHVCEAGHQRRAVLGKAALGVQFSGTAGHSIQRLEIGHACSIHLRKALSSEGLGHLSQVPALQGGMPSLGSLAHASSANT